MNYLFPPAPLVTPPVPIYFESTPLPQRIIDFHRVSKQYPDKYPIIVLSDDKTPQLDKQKYMVIKTMTFGQFATIIRSRLTLTQDMALFYFVGKYKKCVHHSQTIGELASLFANADDHFLVIHYRGESAFG